MRVARQIVIEDSLIVSENVEWTFTNRLITEPVSLSMVVCEVVLTLNGECVCVRTNTGDFCSFGEGKSSIFGIWFV